MASNDSYHIWLWKHLTYVGGQGLYRCTLCETGKFHKNGANTHFNGNRHKMNLHAQFRRDGWILVKKRDIFSRISKLGLPSWRHQVQEPLLNVLFLDSETAHLWPYSKDDGRVAVPASIVTKLEKFEKMEVASLLELVVWKFNCLYLDGSANFFTMQDILDQWAIDDNFDPVEYKRQRRLCSNVGVIVERVLEFLW